VSPVPPEWTLAPAARLLAVGVVLCLAACAPDAEPIEGSDGPPQSSPTSAFVRGIILPGPVLQFRACDQAGTLPLQAADILVRNLLNEMAAAGDPVYAEFDGRIGGRVPAVTITQLHHAAREGRACAGPAPNYELQARGNEPFWGAELDSDHVFWRTPDSVDTTGFAITTREEVGEGILITAVADTWTLKIAFAATPCRDSMADAWYGYTVQAQVGEQTFHGCGQRGAAGR
jgi:uncharacterized membrane protein